MSGRMIQDNIKIAHEPFHFLKNKRNGKDFYSAIKIDMGKAYDHVEWDFLEVVLLKMDFSTKWTG